MKGHNIAVYIIIPLALFSIISLFDNVQAQTNSTSSTNQKTSLQQPSQNTNLIAQSLMKTDIVELMDNLQNAQLAIADGNLDDALKNVRTLHINLLSIIFYLNFFFFISIFLVDKSSLTILGS